MADRVSNRRGHLVGTVLPTVALTISRADIAALMAVVGPFSPECAALLPDDGLVPSAYLPALAMIQHRFGDLATLMAADWDADTIMLGEQEFDLIAPLRLDTTYHLDSRVVEVSEKQGQKTAFDVIRIESLIRDPVSGDAVTRISNCFVILK